MILTKKWVKLVGSDYRLEYPDKMVKHPRDCKCHSIPNHWHYEADKSKPPKKVWLAPTLLEDNGDGTYTAWSYGIWGPVGSTGKLKEGMQVVLITSRSDYKEAERLERLFERSLCNQMGMAAAMSGNPNLIKASDALRRCYKRRYKAAAV